MSLRIAFDNSSLNNLTAADLPATMPARLRALGFEPLISSLNVLEIVQWADETGRERLRRWVREVREMAEFLLLPLPNEIIISEFRAWLGNASTVLLGGDRIATGLLGVLVQQGPIDPELVAEAARFCEREQADFKQRLFLSRSCARTVDTAMRPLSVETFLAGVSQPTEDLAAVFQRWFEEALVGRPRITPDEAGCIVHLPLLRAYWTAFALSAWHQAVSINPQSHEKSGAIDTQQSAYLPLVDVFVTDDGHQATRLREVVRLCGLSTRIVDHRGLIKDLGAATPPEVARSRSGCPSAAGG